MTISVSIPTELRPFVEQELASGAFADEGELVTKALELYREMKLRYRELRDDVVRSLAQAADGTIGPLDIESIKDKLRDELTEDGQSKNY